MTPDEIFRKMCELEEEYVRMVPPCKNKECECYDEDRINHCSLGWWVHTCLDYIKSE